MTAIKKAVLLEDHERFYGLINSIPDIIYFKDAEGRNMFVNKAFETMVGRSGADVIGRTDEEIFPPDLAAACKASDERVRSSGKPQTFEETTHAPDGREIVYETIKSPLCNPAGEVIGMVGISRDITERKRTEAALKESEERFRTLYENATIGLYRTTPDGRILLANPALVRMLGFDSFEDLAALDLEKGEGGTQYARDVFKREIEKNGVIRGWEAVWTKKDGTKVYVRESARAILDASGRVKYFEGTTEDMTERKRAEAELQASEKKFHRIFDRIREGIFQVTVDGRIISANEAMIRMFGYGSFEEFQATPVGHRGLDSEERRKIIETVEKDGEVRNREILLKRKDGTTFHGLTSSAVVRDDAGRIECIEGSVVDVSDLVQSKAALQSALREKETLLKEIYHRVKNNLQTVSGLLRLQSQYLKDPEAVDAFQESQNRIRSMAMIHENLYRSESLSGVDFASYVRNLAQALLGSQANSPGRIQLNMDVEPVQFDLKTAIPLGLIINELVSNALKHAFPKGQRGVIAVGLRAFGPEEYLLSVRDDGVGLPPDLEIGRLDSMGLQLVDMLATQLDGRVEIGPPPGAEVRIRFRTADGG